MSLQDLADTFRADCARATTQAGSGHPTSCFSLADAVAVLFKRVMRWDPDTPNAMNSDFFVLSKGHAAPLLYSALARAHAKGVSVDDLLTLRELGSKFEGHPTPELDWVKFASGSLGQGPGIGVGLAVALRHYDLPGHVYVAVGDGEFAEGSVSEALRAVDELSLRNVTFMVDSNGMGQTDRSTPRSVVDGFSKSPFNAHFVNGHKHDAIYDVLRKKPELIVLDTVKGKGCSKVEGKAWHGKPLSRDMLDELLVELRADDVFYTPDKKIDGEVIQLQELGDIPVPEYKRGSSVATRKAYGTALSKLCNANRRVLVFDADTGNSTFSEDVKAYFDDRHIDVGIAEQNMAGMMLGASGLDVIAYGSTFAAFWARAFDQIRMADLSCDGKKTLVFAGSHCGVSIGQDGSSQMGLEDIGMFSNLFNSRVFYPSDAVSAERLTHLAGTKSGINYLRMSRPETAVLYDNTVEFFEGGSKVWSSGNYSESKDSMIMTSEYKACVVAAGVTLHEALDAQRDLADEGIDILVVDAYSVKPLDVEGISQLCDGIPLITVEDHKPVGGLGAAVAREIRRPDRLLAVYETPHSGKPAELLAKHRIDKRAIVQSVYALQP